MRDCPVIAVTSGEPSGIGPEICLHLQAYATQNPSIRLVLLADRQLMQSCAAGAKSHTALGEVKFRDWNPQNSRSSALPASLELLHVSLNAAVQPGQLNPANSAYVLQLLDRAVLGCQSGEFDALVTAPVHKGVINDAGIPFTGHTEYLADKTHTPHVVMMLVGGGLKVALATTHLALRDVPAAITTNSLEITLRILHQEMQRKYAITAPRILVAGLNPHAGEGGYLGHEEIEIITPLLDRLRAEGMTLIGPLPADTMFTPALLAQGDCVLAMYHDQGLTALKYASFGQGINVTLGLPIIRTSVDHGTALDLAGSYCADPGSLLVAVEQAAAMVRRHQ